MAQRYRIKCMVCGKSGTFADEKDIQQSHWRVVAWDVKNGDPMCVCDKCEYGVCVKSDTKRNSKA